MLARTRRKLAEFDKQMAFGVVLTLVGVLTFLFPMDQQSDMDQKSDNVDTPWDESLPLSIPEELRLVTLDMSWSSDSNGKWVSDGYVTLYADNLNDTFSGSVALSSPKVMRTRDDNLIRVRISRDPTTDLLEELGDHRNIQVTNLTISRLLKVDLVANDRFFEIHSLSTPEQLVIKKGYTEWIWNVRPKRTGKEPLHLRVSVHMMDNLYGSQYRDSKVDIAPVALTTTPWREGQRVIGEEWRWAIGTTTPAAAVAASIQYFRKRRATYSRRPRQRSGSRPVRALPPGRYRTRRRHSARA